MVPAPVALSHKSRPVAFHLVLRALG